MRKRRTKEDMTRLRRDLVEIAKLHGPMTVRQCFYLAVSVGLVAKTEQEYDAVGRELKDLRLTGLLDWDTIVDYTRVMRKPRTYDAMKDALADTARLYRRNIWQDIDVRVEVWCEKETLTGPLLDVTWDNDVHLMPTRGYPSITFLHEAAEHIVDDDKPTFLYYVGDHDPSGKDIPRHVEATLRDFINGEVELSFERLAVLPEQIVSMGLQTRPTKKTDSRAAAFAGDSVEAEAIPPETLRQMVRDAIEQHIPPNVLETHRMIEDEERRILRMRADS